MIPFQQARFVLGSQALLTVVDGSGANARRLLADLWQQIDEFDARFSRFKPNSELTKLNQQAGQPVLVTTEFARFLQSCRHYSAETNGFFNPFILPALQQAGYVGSWPDVAKASDASLDYSDRKLYHMDSLQLDGNKVTIPADAAFDSGGIGKGYLLDQLADWIEDSCDGYWFSLGGDIICGGHDSRGKPWRIGVQAAEASKVIAFAEQQPGERLAVATSGVTKRGGKKGDRAWHHLIDPRIGLSSNSDILTASVAADSAVVADIYASCAVIVGSRKAKELLVSRGLDGLLQTNYSTDYSQSARYVGESFSPGLLAMEVR